MAAVFIGFLMLFVVAILYLPFRFGVCLAYSEGQGELSVVFAVAHLSPIALRVPTRKIRVGAGGVRVPAKVGAGAVRGEVHDTVSPQELLEEAKVPESRLHMVLTMVDLIQVFLLGARPDDNRGRVLGSPLLHLLVGPFAAFGRYFCKCEFSWETALGSKDPIVTALGTGFLWGIKSNVTAVIAARYSMIRPPDITVKPVFDVSRLNTEVRCIFHLSVGDIMRRALRDAVQRWQWKGAGTFGG